MIDTHTHLQFKAFDNVVDQVIKDAKTADIERMIVVGTNVSNSKQAIELANKYEGLYASVGIHPHHIFEHEGDVEKLKQHLNELETLIKDKKVVAIGETGLDRHLYKKTKYDKYKITEQFVYLQEVAFEAQIKLALKYKKSLIIHNISAVNPLLSILEENWDKFFEGRAVIHCCEPDQKLLDFAIKNKVFVGVDGDITEYPAKQEFIKKVPLELLVLETDSPYLTPIGFKSPNTPTNINVICEYIANILKIDKEKLAEITSKNSEELFF